MPWYWPFAAKPRYELDSKLSADGMRDVAEQLASAGCIGSCNGFPITLIARDLALTTAHAAPKKDQRCTFGGEDHYAIAIKPHPYYHACGLYHDVALVKLYPPVTQARPLGLLPDGWERDEVIPTLAYAHGGRSIEEYMARESEPARLFFRKPENKQRAAYWRPASTGDSNGPRLHLLKGRLYLISLYASAGNVRQPGIGPRVTRELVAELKGLV